MNNYDLRPIVFERLPELALLFVYGTLMRGHHNHHIISRSTFIAEDSLRGKLYDNGSYPHAVFNSEATTLVHGEVYDVSGVDLARCDSLESHPTGYARVRVKTEAGRTVFTYHWPHRVRPDWRFLENGRYGS